MAIVLSLLGLYYLTPQIVIGLRLGAGFVVGGLVAWKDEVLFPAPPGEGEPQAEFAHTVEMSRFFGGQPRLAGGDADEGPAMALPTPKPTVDLPFQALRKSLVGSPSRLSIPPCASSSPARRRTAACRVDEGLPKRSQPPGRIDEGLPAQRISSLIRLIGFDAHRTGSPLRQREFGDRKLLPRFNRMDSARRGRARRSDQEILARENLLAGPTHWFQHDEIELVAPTRRIQRVKTPWSVQPIGFNTATTSLPI